MAENLIIALGSKEEKYKCLLPQIKGLITGETDIIANMANVSAAIYETFNHLWVGFYLVKPSCVEQFEEELVLAPFQGPIACTRIAKGRGVCGKAWQSGEIQIVPDVEQFPGHIACSSLSRSEIVIPMKDLSSDVFGVLDIDSKEVSAFDEIDAYYLEEICKLLSP